MSVDQYQRTVNNLDREIAELERKKAAADKKSADESSRAARITINKNASPATIRSKMNEIKRHQDATNKASISSAEYQKKIADKRSRRNVAYNRLQREIQSQNKKEKKEQQKLINDIQQMYEDRIAELEKTTLRTLKTNIGNNVEIESDAEFDVFISHAWEDKESFADEFVSELKKLGVNVWYDTIKINWGDSMRQKIDESLKKSRYGIVVLSPDFIAEGKYWTKTELDGLFQMESINGKTILPIWHNLTKQQVIDFSPIIASKKAMNTASMTIPEIAKELYELIRIDSPNYEKFL